MPPLQTGAEILLDTQYLPAEGPPDPPADPQATLPDCKQSSQTPPTTASLPLDEDRAGRLLATQHRATFVASASALTTLLTLSADSGSSWQLPVHVHQRVSHASPQIPAAVTSGAVPSCTEQVQR